VEKTASSASRVNWLHDRQFGYQTANVQKNDYEPGGASPWGARKVTIKRKSNKGTIGVGTQWDKCVYDGFEMCFTATADPDTKLFDPQGFEVKIE
jgi:hypothetical protein